MNKQIIIRLVAAIGFSVAITWWQVQAGIARCGTIDGGVFLLPLCVLATYLVRGVWKDLKTEVQREYDGI